MEKKMLSFEKLWTGDRFKCYGNLWTKISHDTARQHCKSGLALKELSYGYIGDAICSFEKTEEVEFVPAE